MSLLSRVKGYLAVRWLKYIKLSDIEIIVKDLELRRNIDRSYKELSDAMVKHFFESKGKGK